MLIRCNYEADSIVWMKEEYNAVDTIVSNIFFRALIRRIFYWQKQGVYMSDKLYMKRALEIAKHGAGHTAPNPMVGCVIVRNNKILSEGWHAKYGDRHAEQMALQIAAHNDVDVSGATAYVTLEPCNHYGKTPPCSEALIAADIKRVVIATKDPNAVATGGIERLRSAGILVDIGLCQDDALILNEAFFYHTKTGMPFVTWKVAATADGCIAPVHPPTSPKERQISGPVSNDIVQNMRHEASAIMVGSGTVRADNPRLSDRSGIEPTANPVRVIVGHDPMILKNTIIFESAHTIPTIFAYAGKKIDTQELEQAGITCWYWSEQDVPLNILMQKLGKIGINSVLLEGGATLAAQMMKANLIQKVRIFYAPLLLGLKTTRQAMIGKLSETLQEAQALINPTVSLSGDDVCYTAYIGGSSCLQD